MSSAWMWTIWTLVLLGFMYFALVTDLGTYELTIFMAGAILLSLAATIYERATHPTKP